MPSNPNIETMTGRDGETYWLDRGEGYQQVSQKAFIQAERNAGFHPKPGCGPVATGGFGAGGYNGIPGIKGQVRYPKSFGA